MFVHMRPGGLLRPEQAVKSHSQLRHAGRDEWKIGLHLTCNAEQEVNIESSALAGPPAT